MVTEDFYKIYVVKEFWKIIDNNDIMNNYKQKKYKTEGYIQWKLKKLI